MFVKINGKYINPYKVLSIKVRGKEIVAWFGQDSVNDIYEILYVLNNNDDAQDVLDDIVDAIEKDCV